MDAVVFKKLTEADFRLFLRNVLWALKLIKFDQRVFFLESRIEVNVVGLIKRAVIAIREMPASIFEIDHFNL